MKQKHVAFVVTLFGLAAFAGTPTIAAEYSARTGEYVTSCSRYSNGCYTARLARGAYGDKLVLRNGTRIDCGRDCRGTLREETVDFWDTMRENGS